MTDAMIARAALASTEIDPCGRPGPPHFPAESDRDHGSNHQRQRGDHEPGGVGASAM